MAGDDKSSNDRDTGFNRNEGAPREATPSQELSLRDLRRKPRTQSGSDPYNTSGSFDRTKNWARVGKR